MLLVSPLSFSQTEMSIKKDSLVCISKTAFDKQISYLSQGVKKYVKGCSSTDKEYRVVPINLNLMSPSKFEIIELEQSVWIENSNVKI